MSCARASRNGPTRTHRKGCAFGDKSLDFWDTKDRSAFFFGDINVFFGDTKSLFRDTKNVLDFFGGQRDLINCKIGIDILEGQKQVGFFQRSATQKAAAKAVAAATKQQQKQHKQQEKQYKHLGARVGFFQRTATPKSNSKAAHNQQ